MSQTVTREDFMFEYVSPYAPWAAKALAVNIKVPSPERIAQGWVIEQPTHTYFNWHMNRTDMRLVELEARVAWLEKRLEDAGLLNPSE